MEEVEDKPSPSLFVSTSDESNGKKKKKKWATRKTKRKTKTMTRSCRLADDDLRSLLSLVRSATADARRFLSDNDLLLRPPQTLALESAIKSVAFSLAGLHSILPPAPLPPVPFSPPSPCWFQRFLSGIGAASSPLWIDYFGVSRSTFADLVNVLNPSLGDVGAGSAVAAVAAALYRLAHASPYKAVAGRFGFDGAGSACRAFYGVVKAALCHLPHLLPGVPTESGERARIVKGFGRASLPQCCGALGFRRFPGRGGPIVVQALVDSEGRFLDVSAGWPASASPSTVLLLSKLYSRFEDESLVLGSEPPVYVIGGSCCPLLRWLIVPFPGGDDGAGDDAANRMFNSVHRKGMSLVGAAFASVERRWRLLAADWKEGSLEMLPTVLMACCLLHNFANKCGDVLPWPPEEAPKEEDQFREYTGKNCEEGERVRAALVARIKQES